MYIIFVLGKNYNRGDKYMFNKRTRKVIMPVLYCVCIFVFALAMYFAGKLSYHYLFDKNNDLEYVDGEITDSLDRDVPVVSTSSVISRPYLDNNVSLSKSFYDYKADEESQEQSIIYYENTYMQNSGDDYTSENVFDVISILDGTVTMVKDDNILGKIVEIKHSNDLISVYQSLSEVSVKEGDEVILGQIIGKSGYSDLNKDLGNHLHFELYYMGSIVNPEEFYNKDINEL